MRARLWLLLPLVLLVPAGVYSTQGAVLSLAAWLAGPDGGAALVVFISWSVLLLHCRGAGRRGKR